MQSHPCFFLSYSQNGLSDVNPTKRIRQYINHPSGFIATQVTLVQPECALLAVASLGLMVTNPA